MTEEVRQAIALTRLRGLTQTAALQLYRHYGSAAAVAEARQELEPKWQKAFDGWDEALRRADAELSLCGQRGISAWPLADTDYPARLRECADPPLVVYGLGTANLNRTHVIAVVGTRHISEYGKDICQKFCTELAQLVPDCLIVSGLAYGVDIHTHRACLATGLETVGVLAHGLDRIYPASHRDTAKAMATCGGLLTEYTTGTNPDKGNFVRRNRIVAGLCDATVVVESAAHGGALITARLAQDYDREVFAFPGRVGDRYSEGCNALIRDNRAALITSAADLANALGWQAAERRCEPVQRELFPELDALQQRICDCLKKQEDIGLNRLAMALDEPVQRLSSSLFDLEMMGMVRLLPGGRYRLLR